MRWRNVSPPFLCSQVTPEILGGAYCFAGCDLMEPWQEWPQGGALKPPLLPGVWEMELIVPSSCSLGSWCIGGEHPSHRLQEEWPGPWAPSLVSRKLLISLLLSDGKEGTFNPVSLQRCSYRLEMSARLLCPWDFSGKNTGVGSHFLLQGTFLTQGCNPRLPYCGQILYHLSHQGWKRYWIPQVKVSYYC